MLFCEFMKISINNKNINFTLLYINYSRYFSYITNLFILQHQSFSNFNKLNIKLEVIGFKLIKDIEQV
jgi:hypothetical protein